MDNILKYPQSTIVNRVVPKTMFYKFMEVNPRMKTRFVNDVVNITWLYKLAASTLNVTDTEDMKEIEVFVLNLKQPDCPTDLFSFIDTNMPHHIVFILLHDNHAMQLINYKDWADDTHTKFKITQSFTSSWVALDNLHLQIDGQSLPRIYDNFVAQVSGIGDHKAGSMADIVALKKQMAAVEAELKTLQKRMRKEPQLDRQMLMNKQVKAKRKELDSLKMKLDNLK
ncbi:DUF4391 domain-containing protein [Phocaeicola vulgatus]|uniref:DUF4391 domain-containing protein n=1 Tax=Phocaeicola vulgatus dnLKV7 TaxID=1235786 RepID=R9H0Y4_PHOVU|nr:DUF4391 domain-containing protein [Phocaeicola vulgatus]EOR97687.1 hypothetical protein C800_04094 [Phocaeicola vulgatus dnLKV7]